MNIQWYGHSCFRIEVKEASILIDPFSKDIGLRPPRIKDDIVLVTHNHDDHNNTDGIGDGFLVTHPGEYERKGVFVRGLQSFHDKSEGAERGLNTIYIIRAEDMTICHLGDLGQESLTDKQVEAIGDIDILIVPVGGTSTLDYKEAVQVVNQIEPKVIIPMHYAVTGLKIKLDSADKFIKEIGLSPEKVDKYKIAKKLLPVDEMKLVVCTLE